MFGFDAGIAQWFCDNTPDVMFFPGFGDLPLDVLLFDLEAGNIQIKVK